MEFALNTALVATIVVVVGLVVRREGRTTRQAVKTEVGIVVMHAGAVRALRFLEQAIRNGHDPSLTITAMLMRSERHLPDGAEEVLAEEWEKWASEWDGQTEDP